jgi:uncharacterized membrane protein YeaQ/YmgE (transglycosylase-associated protein family)
MSLVTWIVLGLLAGFIASKIVNRQGAGWVADILLGATGAVIGGCLFRLLGSHGVSGVNLHSMLVSVSGAILVLLAFHLIRRAV